MSVIDAVDDAADVLVDRMRQWLPSHDHWLVSPRPVDRRRFRYIEEFCEIEDRRLPRAVLLLHRRLRQRNVTAVGFVRSGAGSALGWAGRLGLLLAPGKLHAFNAKGERHHLSVAGPIASWRFLRGQSEEQVHRPTALSWLAEALAWVPAAVLFLGWLFARLRAEPIASISEPQAGSGLAMMCLPGDDFVARLDREAAEADASEILATREPRFPDPEIVAAARACLAAPGVWLVCSRAGFKHLLAEGWSLHRKNESGTFCLSASSPLILFRRDVYLRLGGLERFERLLPGGGLAALSLLAWLRGHKTVYAGHIDFPGRPMTGMTELSVTGQPLPRLLTVALDHAGAAARLLHRHGREPLFRHDFWRAALKIKPYRAAGKRSARLLPLLEPGSAVFPGQAVGRPVRVAMIMPSLPDPGGDEPAARAFETLRSLSQHCDIHLFCYSERESDGHIEALLDLCARLVVVRLPPWATPGWPNRWPEDARRYNLPRMKQYVEEFVSEANLSVVQVESAALAFWGKWLRRLPVARVLLEHEIAFQSARRQAARWRRYELRNLRHFDRVVVLSQDNRQALLQRHVDSSKIRLIPPMEEASPQSAEALAALYEELSRPPSPPGS